MLARAPRGRLFAASSATFWRRGSSATMPHWTSNVRLLKCCAVQSICRGLAAGDDSRGHPQACSMICSNLARIRSSACPVWSTSVLLRWQNLLSNQNVSG